MGMLHIEDGRTSAWWLKLGAASVATGLALAWVMVGTAGRSSARPAGPAFAAETLPFAAAHRPSDTPPPRPPNAPAFDPAQAYRTAQSYADCEELNQRDVSGVVSELEESYLVDPSGAMAAPLREAEIRRRAQCQAIGPAEYAKTESLMREAAAHGDLDARYFLLDRRLKMLTDRAMAARDPGTDESPDDGPPPLAAPDVLAEAEAMARQGHRPAMDRLGSDLLVAGLLAPADPVRAAAWRLVRATEPQAGPLTPEDVQANGHVVALGPEDVVRVLVEAKALRDACCKARTP